MDGILVFLGMVYFQGLLLLVSGRVSFHPQGKPFFYFWPSIEVLSYKNPPLAGSKTFHQYTPKWIMESQMNSEIVTFDHGMKINSKP